MAVVKGRSRGNGKQLSDYLLKSKENDRVQVLDIRGTSHPNSLQKSLLEMSLTSELTKGKNGLYHLQFNPAIGEDQTMTPEDWLKAAAILDKHLELAGHKRAIVLHEKKGRVHAHITWERYDHETGRLWDDGLNYRKHDKAREEIERVLGHERTRQQEKERDPEERKKSDYKRELSDLWAQTKDGQEFVLEAEKCGYKIAVGDDRRPWRVITPEGESLDLVRQLETARTKDVRERLQPIREDLQNEAEALQDVREREEQQAAPDPERPNKSRELSDSQDLAAAMIYKVREAKQPTSEPAKSYGYSFTFSQPLTPAPKVEPERSAPEQSDKAQNLSDSQDRAAAMLEQYRQKQADRERKLREAQEAAREQTEKQEQDDKAAELLRQYRERQESRNRNKGLDLEL